MTDEERLGKLVQDLASDPGYASGRRSYPRTVSAEDAAAIAGALNGEIDRGCEARARSAERDGVTIACARGCNGCCEEPILVYRPEALRAADWLARPENAAAREQFLAAYPAWKEKAGDGPEKLAALTPGGDAAAFKAAHITEWRKRVLCAFNRGGDCTIYPVRPGICRNGHAVDTAEYCTGGSDKPAVRLAFVPLDTFMEKARQLLRAAHHAVGGPRGRPEPLCDAVHRLLTR